MQADRIVDRLPALTVCQPYAELIARGGDVKPVENRTWSTAYRGPIAIHAGKSRDWIDGSKAHAALDFGAIVAVGLLVACLPKWQGRRNADHQRTLETWPPMLRHLYDHARAIGPVCWILEEVTRLDAPIACSGRQGVWFVSDVIVQQVREQLQNRQTRVTLAREQLQREMRGSA